MLLQVHSMSKKVEYRGEFVELTDSLATLPAGGQVLLSDSTFQRIGGRLHEVKLPNSAVPGKLTSVDEQTARRSTRASLDLQSRKSSATTADPARATAQGAAKKGLGMLRVDQVCNVPAVALSLQGCRCHWLDASAVAPGQQCSPHRQLHVPDGTQSSLSAATSGLLLRY